MVENDLKTMGIRGWVKITRDRDTWKLILKEAKVLHGP
jgi:ribosomal 30S subunit maturation factor RimM